MLSPLLPKLILTVALGVGLAGILRERGNYSNIGLAVLVACSLLLYYRVAAYYSLFTLCIGFALLPASFGVLRLMNRAVAWFRGELLSGEASERGHVRELGRKSFHLLPLLFLAPIGFVSPADLLVFAVGGGVLPSLVIENLRLRGKLSISPYLLRDKEERGVASYVYLLASVLLTALFFTAFPWPPRFLVAGVFVAVIYDFSSAVVGEAVGRTFVRNDRSLEGTVGGGLVVFPLALYFLPFRYAVLVAVFLCLLDLLHLPLDDNLFLVPLATLFLILIP